MKDILGILADLRRPRLLIRAARNGVDDYRREQHLKRHLGLSIPKSKGAALMQFVEKEGQLNAQRIDGDAAYSLIDHVDILIAIMGEARLLRASRQSQIDFR